MLEFIMLGIITNLMVVSINLIAMLVFLALDYTNNAKVLKNISELSKGRHKINNISLLIPFFFAYKLMIYIFFFTYYSNLKEGHSQAINKSFYYTDLGVILNLK